MRSRNADESGIPFTHTQPKMYFLVVHVVHNIGVEKEKKKKRQGNGEHGSLHPKVSDVKQQSLRSGRRGPASHTESGHGETTKKR